MQPKLMSILFYGETLDLNDNNVGKKTLISNFVPTI